MKKLIAWITLSWAIIMLTFNVVIADEYLLNLNNIKVDLSAALNNGWNLDKYYNDNVDIYQGEYLRATLTNGRAYLWKDVVPPADTTAIVIEYDAAIQYSYWGQNTGVYLVMNNGTQFQFGSGMNGCCDNKNLHQFYINKNNDRLSHILTNLHYGVYHYTVIFSEEEITVQVENENGQIVYNAVIDAPGLHPMDVTKIKYWVYTTTDNNSWMKNLEYGFIHHEKVE